MNDNDIVKNEQNNLVYKYDFDYMLNDLITDKFGPDYQQN